ncbi:nitroreductase family protein [Kitasatospora sp. NPDC018058]|uniref:nitroreductase family protein n=1 Tax=Kitasatospora sp. NPDC018058 TaxID=3364025 RepID=UPI0037C02830
MSDLMDLMAALRQDTERRSEAEHRAALDLEVPWQWHGVSGFGALAEDGLRPALQRRRANRFFADRPVDTELLQRMIEAGQAADAALWPLEWAARPLEFLVVARAVTGLRPAIHRHGPDGFEALADISGTEELSALVLQPEFALAPAILLATGSLEDALDSAGSHGHRRLLERSGAACEAAWLTAVDGGLSGSIFAGFLPSALKRLLGIDGFRRTQLLALAVGHAYDASGEYGRGSANG